MYKKTFHIQYTVPLKSKLTLETRTSRLDPRASMLETFEDRVSSIEKQGFLEYAKTRKGFEETDLEVQVFRIDRYRVKTFDHTIAD